MTESLSITLLPEKRQIQVQKGTIIADCLGKDGDEDGNFIIAASVNNEYVSLMDHLNVDCSIIPIYVNETSGMRIYRNSLILLFEMALRSIYPEKRMMIGHSLGHSFYLRFVDDGDSLKEEDAVRIENKMRELVEADEFIFPRQMSWNTAVEIFRKHHQAKNALLIEELNEPLIEVWECAGHIIQRYSPLVRSTSVLKVFAIKLYGEGFLLCYPSAKNPLELANMTIEKKLYSVYTEHKQWAEILGVSNVSSLNALSRNRSEARDFIQTAEALHSRKIAEVAGKIAQRCNDIRAVMIAGPSSSGKTTFTKKLALSLKSIGIRPRLISLDDYYKNRNNIPLDEQGKPNLEVLEALDIALFNENLKGLFAGLEVSIPIFDFKKLGVRLEEGRSLQLDEKSVLLIEGIHGLNPDLTPGLDEKLKFGIYISPLTQLNLDDHTRIPTTDNRIIRRIVRDHQFRRYPAIKTLKMWPSVRRGEEQHIFPWQGRAQIMFNSALEYELAVLKVFAEPLLRGISPAEREYGEARRLLSLLKNFLPLPVEEVPELSILREFIGRSGFRY